MGHGNFDDPAFVLPQAMADKDNAHAHSNCSVLKDCKPPAALPATQVKSPKESVAMETLMEDLSQSQLIAGGTDLHIALNAINRKFLEMLSHIHLAMLAKLDLAGRNLLGSIAGWNENRQYKAEAANWRTTTLFCLDTLTDNSHAINSMAYYTADAQRVVTDAKRGINLITHQVEAELLADNKSKLTDTEFPKKFGLLTTYVAEFQSELSALERDIRRMLDDMHPRPSRARTKARSNQPKSLR